MATDKSPEAFRTISEVSTWLDTPAHVLRFWESRFTQVKPVKRAGGRRYYRPADMLLLGGIKKLLHEDGMTIRGVQKILREDGVKHVAALSQPLDDEETVDIAGAFSDTDEPDTEAPMALDAQAEVAEVLPMRRRPPPEPDEAILPGLELRRPAPTPAPAPAPAPVPAPTAAPAGRPAPPPDIADAPWPRQDPDSAAEDLAESDAWASPPPMAEPLPQPTRDPEPAVEPDHAPEPEAPIDLAPAESDWPADAADTPEPAPEPEPEPDPEPQPLGTDLPVADPEDDDPAYAASGLPARSQLLQPGLRRHLAADPEAARGAVDRLNDVARRIEAVSQD
ncbi:MerR family transcriptional regulator [Rhodovulum kholense]|uniref:DNA-binding transcriptional MerR regulator n=1 Tax=Rhodovulum kholense TaxID=453584 RepID=A0A8E2VI09_9RHOB|nr:MerR family transcriptional regulator [Rhodovulum kholense]PTW47052.1 DNA-binding transcriptional MerR regulator [Rhodovulum kholense]